MRAFMSPLSARILFISDIRDGLNIKTKLSSITHWHSILTEMHPRFTAALYLTAIKNHIEHERLAVCINPSFITLSRVTCDFIAFCLRAHSRGSRCILSFGTWMLFACAFATVSTVRKQMSRTYIYPPAGATARIDAPACHFDRNALKGRKRASEITG